jgi:hypothetical protein
MATKKKVETTEELKRVPQPPVRQELIGDCADTGSKIVHVAQKYYRFEGEAVEVCGITAEGQPDGNWIKDANPPMKALSMLGRA